MNLKLIQKSSHQIRILVIPCMIARYFPKTGVVVVAVEIFADLGVGKLWPPPH